VTGFSKDEVSSILARYAAGMQQPLTDATRHHAKRILVDSIAVAIGALDHTAAVVARRFGAESPTVESGSLIWGTRTRTTPETAALVNGVLMRCYDFNDIAIGSMGGGHPSDMVPGLIAVAEWKNRSGAELIAAMAVGYEILFSLFDSVSSKEGGWDYTNITAIGATCAVGRLMGLSPEALSEAVGITAISHLVSDEIESRELNADGDLTMWKRFNGANAVRQGIYSCQLAMAGAEAVVRPFVGRHGFLSRVNPREGFVSWLADKLDPARAPARIAGATMKRWPVGSRGQSAIQAAFAARSQFKDPKRIAAVNVLTEEATYDHLFQQQKDPFNPISRETADHSLPYIVAVALQDGQIQPESFDLDRVNALKASGILGKLTVKSVPRSELGSFAASSETAKGFLTRLQITTNDGETIIGEALPPPGHPATPLSDDDLNAKLHEYAKGRLDAADKVLEILWSVENQSVRALSAALASAHPRA
jgi:2-methylcitrate dehydratase